jgi:hypothetical protein
MEYYICSVDDVNNDNFRAFAAGLKDHEPQMKFYARGNTVKTRAPSCASRIDRSWSLAFVLRESFLQFQSSLTVPRESQ